ncbi:MAG TPA: hypothetical protein VJR95_09705 [Rhodanobacter sp.]|nr:hypothetical protein [Rhodanobacter sp.]
MTVVGQTATYRTALAELPRDRGEVLTLWRDNLGDPARHRGKYDWFYLGGPFGPSLLQLLSHGGAAIGTCGVGARRMLWQGREIRAGLLADMAVDARHRTLGPALMLQEALVASAAGHFDLLYGFPNRKSLPVVKRLGYAVLGELSRHARVLRHAHYLRRRLPRWLAALLGGVLDAERALLDGLRMLPGRGVTATWSEQADPRMDALWQVSPHGQGLLGMHDGAMMRWRFDQSPLADVRYLLLVDRRGGSLRAWFACECEDRVLQVRDYWSERGVEGIDHRMVLALVRSARREGCVSVTLECAAPAARMAGWRRAGFILREGQPVVGKWLGDATVPAELARDWHLTEADADE